MRFLVYSLCCLALLGCDSLKQRLSWIDHALHLHPSGPRPTEQSIESFFEYTPETNHPYLSADFQETLDIRTHSRLTQDNQVNLLPNARSVQVKLDLIHKAQKRLLVATFQIVCDHDGEIFARALESTAKRGVEVRFLITGGPWTWGFSGKCPDSMKKAGIQVGTMPYSYITNHGVVQLHDKIFIVDEKVAIVGGQNIGTWYSKKQLNDLNFRDTDAIVSGPVVEDIFKRYVNLWHLAKPGDSTLLAPILHHSQLEYSQWLQKKPLKGLCRFVSQIPSKEDFSVFETYKLYAESAQKRLIFHSLALNAFGSEEQESLWQAFLNITKQPDGKVFLLTNGPGFMNSNMMPAWVGWIVGHYFLNSVYDSLKATDIEAFAYPTWLHSKTYLFDNLAVGIGSFNFDETGLIWTENSLICLDDVLRNEIIEMFKIDLRHSYQLKNP